MREGNLYCIVADPSQARFAKPDMGCYSPKELAAKECVSTTAVYTWIKDGLPVVRRGKMGNILIYYQDYIQWMIDCAKESEPPTRDIPGWAYRFVKSATPKSTQNQRNLSQKKENGTVCNRNAQKNPQKVAFRAKNAGTSADVPQAPKTPLNARKRHYTPSLSFLDVLIPAI